MGGSAAPLLVRTDGRGVPASTVFAASHGCGGGTGGWPTAAGPGVAKDIEVYIHYGQEGGVGWQPSWFVEFFAEQG